MFHLVQNLINRLHMSIADEENYLNYIIFENKLQIIDSSSQSLDY